MSAFIRLAVCLLCLALAIVGGLTVLWHRGIYSALLWCVLWSALAECVRPSVDDLHAAAADLREQLDGE